MEVPHGSLALPEDNIDDGLQFLTEKYSELITRVKSEAFVKNRCEALVTGLRLRVKQEEDSWASAQARWDAERANLQQSVALLRQRCRCSEEADEAGSAELIELRSCAEQAERECQQLDESSAHEGAKAQRLKSHVITEDEQHEQLQRRLVSLRSECEAALSWNARASEELSVCRAQGDKLRNSVMKAERLLNDRTTERERVDSHVRDLKDELRQALRTTARAKSRIQDDQHHCERVEEEVRSKAARLGALRNERQRLEGKAETINRQCEALQSIRDHIQPLERENNHLRGLLDAEVKGKILASQSVKNSQAAQKQEEAKLSIVKDELFKAEERDNKLEEEIQSVNQERDMRRSELREIEVDRATGNSLLSELRTQLSVAKENEQRAEAKHNILREECRHDEQQLSNVTSRLREARRRVRGIEASVATVRQEAAQERRAADQCHRAAAQGRERLRNSALKNDRLQRRAHDLAESTQRIQRVYSATPAKRLPATSPLGRPRSAERLGPSTPAISSLSRPRSAERLGQVAPPLFHANGRSGRSTPNLMSPANVSFHGHGSGSAGRSTMKVNQNDVFDFIQMEDARLESPTSGLMFGDIDFSGWDVEEPRPPPTPILDMKQAGSGAGHAVLNESLDSLEAQLLQLDPIAIQLPKCPPLALLPQ